MYDSIELTNDDRRNGFVMFSCPEHGGITATFPRCSVRCGCGSPAAPTTPTSSKADVGDCS